MPDPPPSPHPLFYAQPPARESPTGVISFVCGIIAIMSFCTSLTAFKTSITPRLAILIFAAFVCILLLGLVTGIIGVRSPGPKRGLAIAGLILNGVASLLILLLTMAALLGLD